MSLENRKIENAFISALVDIHKKISSLNISVRIKAIQFLLPDSHLLSGKIQRFIYCEPETKEIFEKAVEEFVFNGIQNKTTPERSLYYLEFRDPFKYKCYGKSSWKDAARKAIRNIIPNSSSGQTEFNNSAQFELSLDPPFPVSESDRIRLSDLNKVSEFWTTWHKILEKHNLGRSTLWTYIRVSKENDQGNLTEVLSSAFIVFDGCLKSSEKTHKLQSITNKRIQDALYKLTLDLFNLEIYRQATRAAISQVMARNMSHNIGSHVLSRMEAPSNNEYQGFTLNTITTNKHEKLTAIFNSYLKSRMDFLADITTGVPTIENSKWFYKELLSGIDKNRLLLNKISGIGGFYYRIKAINFAENSSGVEVSENENDLMVSIPNDVLGCHAFYTIIENIIRNCAKHGGKGDKGKTSQNPLNICINIKECEEQQGNELYEITIYDDGEDLNDSNPIFIEEKKENAKYKKYFTNENGEKYFTEQNGKISVKPLDKLVFDQNYRLNQSVLKDGALRQGAWGLIEMDASAAYLRKIPVEQIDEDIYDINLRQTPEAKESYYPEKVINPEFINILKAVAVDERFLGYRLFMFKPREILIIDEIGFYKNIDDSKRKELLKSGILICSLSETEGYFKYNSEKVYNHKIVVILSDRSDEIAKKNMTGLSRRILKINSEEIEKLATLQLLTNPLIYKKEIWKLYITSTNYSFYNDYTGFKYFDFIEKITNDSSPYGANYFDHGEGYSCSEIEYKEIKYSAVEGFMPTPGDEIKLIQFIESIHNNIVVIDERIQEYAEYGEYKPKNGKNIKISDIYKHTNIYVPKSKSECNLGLQSFDDEYSKILAVFEQQKEACFFVVHLGIIEKLIESHNKKEEIKKKYNKDRDIEIADFLNDLIFVPNKISYNRLIIISGRGTPHNLPPNTRYLNYSIISQYMIDLRFKYLLSEAVFSSRKIKSC